jgi:hypothetical protein
MEYRLAACVPGNPAAPGCALSAKHEPHAKDEQQSEKHDNYLQLLFTLLHVLVKQFFFVVLVQSKFSSLFKFSLRESPLMPDK